MAPVLLALDAHCYIADEESQESVPLTDFFVGPRRTVLEDRLLVGLALPATARELALRRPQADPVRPRISPWCRSTVALGIDDGRIADGADRPGRGGAGAPAGDPGRRPARRASPATTVTAELLADAAAVAAGECDPHQMTTGPAAEYRRDMVRVLTRRLLARR